MGVPSQAERDRNNAAVSRIRELRCITTTATMALQQTCQSSKTCISPMPPSWP